MAAGRPFEFMEQFYSRPNRVKEFQKFFQSGPLPIHLKGRVDISFYRTFIMGSGLGVMFGLLQFSRMALGHMKREK